MTFAHQPSSSNDARLIVAADNVEVENAHKLKPDYWRSLDRYFARKCNLPVSLNAYTCTTFDTDNLDLLRVGYSLGGRPAGTSSSGYVFPDQFTLKFRHEAFQVVSNQIAMRLSQHQGGYGLPRVRGEIERSHTPASGAASYKFQDLPNDIREKIRERLAGADCDGLIVKPRFLTYVARRRYEIIIDPDKPFDPVSVVGANGKTQTGPVGDRHVFFEICMDKCVYREPKPGMTVQDIAKGSKDAFNGFGRHRNDQYIMEYEFRRDDSGPTITDEIMLAAYTRLKMFLYDLGMPFSNGKPGIKPAGSKAARGFKAMLTSRGGMAKHPDGHGLWRMAP